MEPRAREWMLATARGDYHAIARILRDEPRLARRRVSYDFCIFFFYSILLPESGVSPFISVGLRAAPTSPPTLGLPCLCFETKMMMLTLPSFYSVDTRASSTLIVSKWRLNVTTAPACDARVVDSRMEKMEKMMTESWCLLCFDTLSTCATQSLNDAKWCIQFQLQ